MREKSAVDPTEARRLIERLADDDLQKKLRPGFEREFAASLIEQWRARAWLSPRQLEVLTDLIGRHDGADESDRAYSRRYEGWTPHR